MTDDVQLVSQQECNEMSAEQISKLAASIIEFIQTEQLQVGITLLIADRDGYKSVGNMPPDAQAEMYTVLHSRLDKDGNGADVSRELFIDVRPDGAAH